MRKITSLLFVVCCILQVNSFAQDAFRTCGSMEVLDRQLKADPGMQARMEQIEQFTNSFIAKQKTNRTAATIVTIPVVVHVVYNTTAQNISDAQVLSQIDVLNKDYAKMNSDTGSVPAMFKSLVSNTGVQFCMAQRDPSGNPSTGIVRKQTTKTSFTDDDAVKKSASNGDNAWDATKYLNIWVCNLGGGLLGYAQFPGGTAATDGVVINYTAFGNIGTAASPYNLGRTATHEIGHWLNLRHIWGDANCGNDLVADTPTQQTANYGCPTFPHKTCSNNGDMSMNYMDYTDDRCMYMFSAGQAARMDALFATGGARFSLLTSNGCVPPTGGCYSPTNLMASSITQTSATLSWTAVGTPTGYTIQYKPTTGSTWTTITSASTSIAISGLTSNTAYQFQVQATCTSGTSTYSSVATFTTAAEAGACVVNAYEPNNSMTQLAPITVATDVKAMIETGSDIDWFSFTNTAAQPNIQLNLTNLPKDYLLGLYKAGVQLASSSNTGTADEAITYTTTTVGTYWIRVAGNSTNFSNTSCYTLRATIYGAQPTCGMPSGLSSSAITQTGATASWTAVSGATSYNLQYKTSASSTWTTVTGITTTSYVLTGLTAGTTYNFQVAAVCSSGTSAYSTASSFTTTTATTCGVPSGLSSSNLTQTGATLAWTAVANATSYNIQYRIQNTSTWMTTTSSTNSKALTGLSSKTAYEFQVAAVCSSGTSAFSASGMFTTLGETTTTCTANAYEPNNTMGQLTPIALNTEINAMIEIGSDVDWFSFSNAAGSTNIQVRLYNLPKDYSLALYKSGALLTSSANTGTTDEVINYNTSVVGSYWARVSGNSSNYSNTLCYSLKATTSGTPFLVENTNTSTEARIANKNIRIYPNPSSGEFMITYNSAASGQVIAKVMDLSGSTLFANTFDVSEGENNMKISLQNMAAGLYLVEINDGTENTVHKIMINK